MIYYNIPWNTDKNIGIAYNSFMKMLNDEDYACFIDADACFTTYYFGKQLEDIVREYPECGFFTGRTNRVGCKWQVYIRSDARSNDIKYHRIIGEKLYNNNYKDCIDRSNEGVMSGVLMLIRKSTWKKVGGFLEDGMLGVDNDFHNKCIANDEKLYLMKGVYVYHWYRGGGNDKSHLK